MKYLFNGRGVYYEIKAYSKARDVMTLVDPHTEEVFQLHNVKEVLPICGYKVIKWTA